MSIREGGQRNGMSPFGGCRVYVGDIGYIKRTELEKEFGQYGPVIDVWMGANRDTVGPNYAFVVFRYPEDAEEAVKDRNGRKVCGQTVRVEHARPARQRPIRKSFGFSRNFRRPYQRQWCQSRNRSNSRSRSRSRSKSRSSSRGRNRKSDTSSQSRSRSSSPERKKKSDASSSKSRKSNSGANKSKRKSSSSPSVSPGQSRHKGKQSSGSRISPSRSSSRSVSPPLMKKQTEGEKPQTRSDSASPKG